LVKKHVIGQITLIEAKFGSFFVQRPSMMTGKVHAMCMNGPPIEAVAEWLAARFRGEPAELIQVAFPNLNDEEREFLLSGIIAEEWAQAFPKGDDEDEEQKHDG
jgi:hypothetical protein